MGRRGAAPSPSRRAPGRGREKPSPTPFPAEEETSGGEASSLTSELTPESDLSRGEESPAGSGWSSMGGGGDEHLGGRTGPRGGGWEEDWEAGEGFEEESEQTDLYGERLGKPELEDE